MNCDGSRLVRNRPFSSATLGFAKAHVIRRGGNASNHDELTAMLHAVFNRIDDHVIQNKAQKNLAKREIAEVMLAQKDHSRLDNPFGRADNEGDRYQPSGAIAAMPLLVEDRAESEIFDPETSFDEITYGSENEDDDLF